MEKLGAIISFAVVIIAVIALIAWNSATCIGGECLGCVSDSYCAPEAMPRLLREKVGGYIIEPASTTNIPKFDNIPASTVDQCINAAKSTGGVCALFDGNQKVCSVFKSTDGIVANYYDKPAPGFTSIVITKSPPLCHKGVCV
jgi:hypothetical protein